MMASKSSSAPIGHWTAFALASKRDFNESTDIWKSAPILSILLTKTIRGTSYVSAWRQTVSVCGSTPAAPSRTATAPSRTRNERSTSIVKSTCPGVSMMLTRYGSLSYWSWNPRQTAVVAADWIVIPRSFSCSMKSICEAPSWVSPILWILPV